MNCDEVRQHWELYYDSEGDSELYLQINDHLAGCPACSQWFFEQGQFEDALAARLATGDATPDLWQRVLCETGVAVPVAARGWSFFSPFLALAASLLVIVGIWKFTSEPMPDHLASLTAACHQRLVSNSDYVDFRSLSDQEVEEYLKRHVSFPVRCPPRKDVDFVVHGGGVCTIAGGAAAYVVGKVEDADVSIFILPVERLSYFAHERDVLSRQAMHHCREGHYDMVLAKIDRHLVVVIGEGAPEQLERVARAYGTYPETPTSDAV